MTEGTPPPVEPDEWSRAKVRLAADAIGLALAKLAVGAWVLCQGFSHVSDDDYARTVIAEQFAHAPRLDPSGTSWLPAPFWIEGATMACAGRTLGTARAVAVVLGCVTVAAPYLAARSVGVDRFVALAATAVAMSVPWNAWLGVATVPEGWSAALVAAAIVAMSRRSARPWAAAGLVLGSLSRYEAWPACLAMAACCARTVWQDRRGRPNPSRPAVDIACATAALVGPAGWMTWNAVAHGSPFHFMTRVSAFRQAIGAANVSVVDKLLGYPGALLLETPEVAILGALGLAGLALAPIRARWRWPAMTALATLLLLVLGDLKDGAPTHHAVRALAPTWWIFVMMGIETLVVLAARPRWRWHTRVLGGVASLAWCVTLPARWDDSPGRSASEDRGPAIARGLALRAAHVQHAEISPCAFEHFALIAAWGAPERATVHAGTGEPPGPGCPSVSIP